MRVHPQLLPAAVFFGKRKKKPDGSDGVHFGGTGFLVTGRGPGKNPQVGESFPYTVTAKHVAERLSQEPSFIIRALKSDGTVLLQEIDPPVRWFEHPTDRTADAAVMLGAFGKLMVGLPDSFLLPDSEIAARAIGVGDRVLTVGLFASHAGRDEHVPIVRQGHIAMLPKEPVSTPQGLADLHVIEARSMLGLSGSPVFVVQTKIVKLGEHSLSADEGGYVLGMIRAHWTFELPSSNTDSDRFEREQINAGLALVTPAQKILDTIGQPEIQELTAKDLDALRISSKSLKLTWTSRVVI